MADFERMAQCIMMGRVDKDSPLGEPGQPGVKELTQQAIEEGLSGAEILNNGLLAGMNTVAARFRADEMFIPEVLQAANALKTGIALLKPFFGVDAVRPLGKIVIGTVAGDVHDIGKSLVAMMLEGACFEVTDIGIDVPTQRFVQIVKAEVPDVLAMSALLTTTMGNMLEVISALEEASLRDQVKVIVGGAPLTQAYADEIGADGYAPDAVAAIDKVKELMGS